MNDKAQELLRRYIRARRALARAQGRLSNLSRGPAWASEGKRTETVRSLVAHHAEVVESERRALESYWQESGMDVSELERALEEADFRADALALAADPTLSADAALAAYEQFEARLRDYWVGAGHDMVELDDVFSEALADIADTLGQ